MELYEEVKKRLDLSKEEWKCSGSPVRQKQKLFARGGLLILKDKLSKIVRSLLTSLCKIYQEQGIISSHDNKPIFTTKTTFILFFILFDFAPTSVGQGGHNSITNYCGPKTFTLEKKDGGTGK